MNIEIEFHTNWFVEGDIIKPVHTEQRVYKVIFEIPSISRDTHKVIVEPQFDVADSDLVKDTLWEKVAHALPSGDALWEDLGRTESRKIKLLNSEIL